MKLTWKNTFGGDYNIFDGCRQIGYLQPQNISNQTTFGEINGCKVMFVRKNLFDQTVIIYNASKERIGYITFEIWNNRANISLRNELFLWKYSNFMNNSWIVEKNHQQIAEFKKGFITGTINSENNNEEILLAALLVHRQRRSSAYAVLFILLLPIFMRFLSNL